MLPDSTGLAVPRFPSQYVESAAELILGLALLAVWRRSARPGTVAAVYAIGYGILRATLEPFRGDSTSVGPLGFATWWGAALAIAGTVALVLLRRSTIAAVAPARPVAAGGARGT